MTILDNHSEDKFKQIVLGSNNLSEVALKLGYKNTGGETLKLIEKRIEIDKVNISHFKIKRQKSSIVWLINLELLTEYVTDSYSYTAVLVKLGYSKFSGHALVNLKKRMLDENIDITHFNGKSIFKFNKFPNSKVFVENSTYARYHIKKRILDEKLIPYSCCECGNEGEHNGKVLVLELDHKNGVNNDNRLENLRFLCPNCHAQEPTSGGKNIKKGVIEKREIKRILLSQKPIKLAKTKYTCTGCGSLLAKTTKTGLCRVCFNKAQQRVVRPSYMQILEDKLSMSMLAIGAKYGASDNAVRKWIRMYERELEKVA